MPKRRHRFGWRHYLIAVREGEATQPSGASGRYCLQSTPRRAEKTNRPRPENKHARPWAIRAEAEQPSGLLPFSPNWRLWLSTLARAARTGEGTQGENTIVCDRCRRRRDDLGFGELHKPLRSRATGARRRCDRRRHRGGDRRYCRRRHWCCNRCGDWRRGRRCHRRCDNPSAAGLLSAAAPAAALLAEII